jgi:hypothetical protein
MKLRVAVSTALFLFLGYLFGLQFESRVLAVRFIGPPISSPVTSPITFSKSASTLTPTPVKSSSPSFR